ncbi:TATA box-binding protein-associated factor RNA polymerase I subunit A [Phlyctochytrium planicorne]|nr:TATA box-binding protein-associated factor RNA polymerase I subunit A [Phlyctochytrium planicorne]
MAELLLLPPKVPFTETITFTTLLNLMRAKLLDRYHVEVDRTFPMHNQEWSNYQKELAVDSKLFVESALDAIVNRKKQVKEKNMVMWRKNITWKLAAEVHGSNIPIKMMPDKDTWIIFSDQKGTELMGTLESKVGWNRDRETMSYYQEASKVTYKRKYIETQLLVETLLCYIRLGQVKEAYEYVERMVDLVYYKDDPLILGYAGLVAYIMWRKEVIYMTAEGETSGITDSVYYRTAKNHFINAVEAGGIGNDLFILYYVQLELFADEVDKVKGLLERFHNECPDNPNSHLYLYIFLRAINAPSQEWVPVAAGYVKADPTGDPAFALEPLVSALENDADLFITRDKHGVSEAEMEEAKDGRLRYLASALEHVCHHLDICDGTIWSWRALRRLTEKIRDLGTFEELVNEFWESKRGWWGWRHFPAVTPQSNVSRELEDLQVAKVITGHMLFPEIPAQRLLGPLVAGELCERSREIISSYSQVLLDTLIDSAEDMNVLKLLQLEREWKPIEIERIEGYYLSDRYTSEEVLRASGYTLEDHWGQCDCCSSWDDDSSDEDESTNRQHLIFQVNHKIKALRLSSDKGSKSNTDEEEQIFSDDLLKRKRGRPRIHPFNAPKPPKQPQIPKRLKKCSRTRRQQDPPNHALSAEFVDSSDEVVN